MDLRAVGFQVFQGRYTVIMRTANPRRRGMVTREWERYVTTSKTAHAQITGPAKMAVEE